MFPVRGHFFGRLSIDSLDYVVNVDSVVLETSRTEVLGAIGVALGGHAPNGHWDTRHGSHSRYLVLDSALVPGRPIVLRGLHLSGRRTQASSSLQDGWLVFVLVLGPIPGGSDSRGIGTVYMHSRRDLLSGVAIPKIAATAARDTAATTGIVGPEWIPPSCGPIPIAAKGTMVVLTIDTLGVVDPTMIRPFDAAAGAISEATRHALARCRYHPGRLDGRAVRMATVITL